MRISRPPRRRRRGKALLYREGPANYRRLVISSDGFVMTAHGLADYPRAIHSKLTRELVDPTS